MSSPILFLFPLFSHRHKSHSACRPLNLCPALRPLEPKFLLARVPLRPSLSSPTIHSSTFGYLYISKKKHMHLRRPHCILCVLWVLSSVPASVRFPCVLSPSPTPASHYCVLSCAATLPCIRTWRPPCSLYPSVLTLSIRQPLLEAVRIIILLPLVSWREPCASPVPAKVLWRLSRVVITGTFNSCINYIFSSY